MFARRDRLPVVILRTSRFFPEADDTEKVRARFETANMQVNELLYRRADVADVVTAHLSAMDRAPLIKFGCFIVSATTPFTPSDLADLRRNAPAVVRRVFPHFEDVYADRRWTMLPSLDRVYVNAAAREALGWRPRYDFGRALDALRAGEDFRSALAVEVGAKGYHSAAFSGKPYPVTA